MEPTISAATKAALFPRKNILAERNEASTFNNSLKPPILHSGTSPLVSACSLRSSCSSDNDEDEENSVDGNSSLKKPYDPLTNYLSPRPKYLRYNPNQKRRIFMHGDGKSTEKKDGLGVVSISSSFESQKVVEEKTFEEGSVKEENVELEKTEGNNPNDHDDEGAEMEEFEEFEEEKCWSLLGLLKILLVLGSLFLSTSYICSMNSPEPSLINEAIREFRYGFFNQSNTHFASKFEVLDDKREEFRTTLPAATQEEIDVKVSEVSRDDKEELLTSTAGLPEVQTEKSEDVYDGLMSKVEASDALQWAEATESETNTDVAASGVEASSDQLWNSDFRENIGVRDQEMGGIQDGLDQLQSTENSEVKDFSSETEASPDSNVGFEQVESEDIKLKLEVSALVVMFSIVLALSLIYHSRRKNSGEASLHTQKNLDEEAEPTQENNSEEASLPNEMQQPNAERARQIQITNAICSVEEEHVKKVASFDSPSSMNIVSEEFSRQRQAPIVELLGELVIGEETSSFVRSSKLTRMPGPEERNASNSLSTQMMKSCSKASSVQNQLHPTQLELSTADSTSHKKRLVKEVILMS